MRFIAFRSVLLMGACLAFPHGANAQDARHSNASDHASGGDDQQMAEIVVTAQFRSQRLQDTPLAISAVDSATMAARSQVSITDVAKSSPSVSIEPNNGGGGPAVSSVTIRGIGQTDSIGGVEPGVGVYIDDVYYGILNGAAFELLDLDRVEILRGPQGTLSGKNSEGGSIKLYSKKPSNDTEGSLELTYGSFNRMQARGSINLPLVDDRIMLRVSGVFRKVDGFMDRLDYRCVNPGATDVPLVSPGSVNNNCVIGHAGGQDLAAVRAALRLVLSDGVEDTITVDRMSDHREPDAIVQTYQSSLWAGTNNFVTAGTYNNYAAYIGNIGTTNEYQAFQQNNADQWGVSNKFEANLSDHLTLTSITAYRKTTAHGISEGALSPFNVFLQDTQYRHKQFTQELRLSGQVGAFADWTVGGFYYDANAISPGLIDIPGGLVVGGGGLDLGFITNDPIKSKSKSGFGHLVLHLTDSLNLTGGLRYTDESKDYTFSRRAPDGGVADFRVASLDGVTGHYSGNRWDWRVALDYRWSPNLMTYAQVATGFKGGGINPRPFFPSQAVPYVPESVISYEAGFKSDLFDRHLRFNASAFYTDFKNMQLIVNSCDAISPFPGAPCTQTTNAGGSKLWGVEIEAEVHPVDGFSIDASASFLDFKYKSVNADTNISPSNDLPFLVKTKISVGAQYEFPVFSGKITPRVDFDYRSGFETEADRQSGSPYGYVNGRSLVNARISYKTDDGKWEIAGAVTNLFDKYYYVTKFDRTNAPYFTAQAFVGRPREASISVKRTF